MDPTAEDTSGRPRRKIVLTETGRALFEQSVSKFWTKQRTVRRKLEAEMKEMATDSKESYHLQRDRLINLAKEYCGVQEELLAFLERSNTKESEREKASQKVVTDLLMDKVSEFVRGLDSEMSSFVMSPKPVTMRSPNPVQVKIPKPIQVKAEPRDSPKPAEHEDRKSIRSRRSAGSHRSAASSISLAQQRLEAEETKAKLQYARKEAKLRKEQASIQVDLEVLDAERDAAVAEAKLRALESMEPDYISVSSESVAEPVVEVEDPIERARNFVEGISLQPVETTLKEPLTEMLNEESHKQQRNLTASQSTQLREYLHLFPRDWNHPRTLCLIFQAFCLRKNS